MSPANQAVPVAEEFAGHCPGPWGVERTPERFWIGPMREDGWKVDAIVCCCDRDDEHYAAEASAEKAANARLIAAAPQLLRERDEARAERDKYRGLHHRVTVEVGAALDAFGAPELGENIALDVRNMLQQQAERIATLEAEARQFVAVTDAAEACHQRELLAAKIAVTKAEAERDQLAANFAALRETAADVQAGNDRLREMLDNCQHQANGKIAAALAERDTERQRAEQHAQDLSVARRKLERYELAYKHNRAEALRSGTEPASGSSDPPAVGR